MSLTHTIDLMPRATGVARLLQYTETVDLAVLTTGPGIEEQTVTITGLTTADSVVSFEPITLDLTGDDAAIVYARISAANTIAVGIANYAAATPDPAAGTIKFLILKAAT